MLAERAATQMAAAVEEVDGNKPLPVEAEM